MTPEMTSEIAPKRIAERKYRFHCLCGATLVTTEKTGTCTNCGKAFGIRRVGKRTHWRMNTAQPIVVQDVLELVEQPVVFITLLLLLLCWLYELACG